jgi:hypothetical protein
MKNLIFNLKFFISRILFKLLNWAWPYPDDSSEIGLQCMFYEQGGGCFANGGEKCYADTEVCTFFGKKKKSEIEIY